MMLVAEPVLGAEERAAVRTVLSEGWITLGPRVREFERAFALRHGAEDAVAVDSCTAALHLVLAALGIGPDDEVLVPTMTFVATANAVIYTGATPVFVDIEALDSPIISLADAEARISPKTRAVMVMHFAGHMAPVQAWRSFASRHGLLLIEDAAHAAGGPDAGTYGDGAAFSFYGNKNMTTAEGGMVLMRDPAALERVRQMRGHGMTRSVVQRLNTRSSHYDVTMLGYNYRMDELRAALGLVQLRKLDGFNRRRAALTARYFEDFRSLAAHQDGFCLPKPRTGVSACHIFPVLLPAGVDRDAVAAALAAAGIQTTVHYPPVHSLSFYRERYPDLRLPVSEEFHRRELTLPLHPKMRDADVDRVVEAVQDALVMA